MDRHHGGEQVSTPGEVRMRPPGERGFDSRRLHHSTDTTCPQCLGHLTASADVCWHCGLYDPTSRKDPHA